MTTRKNKIHPERKKALMEAKKVTTHDLAKEVKELKAVVKKLADVVYQLSADSYFGETDNRRIAEMVRRIRAKNWIAMDAITRRLSKWK